MSKNFVFIFVVLVFIIGGLFYIYNPVPTKYENPRDEEPVACTMDAKLCPDGSYVGRTGPNCEFVCPTKTLCEGGVCPEAPSAPIFEDGTKVE